MKRSDAEIHKLRAPLIAKKITVGLTAAEQLELHRLNNEVGIEPRLPPHPAVKPAVSIDRDLDERATKIKVRSGIMSEKEADRYLLEGASAAKAVKQ